MTASTAPFVVRPAAAAGPRVQRAKVLVTGPFDAGKTTFVQALADGEVVTTERPVTGSAEATTTVAMDFGRVAINDDLALHLVGVPGQSRFAFVRDLLATGILGFVVLVDGTRPDTWTLAATIADEVAAVARVPYVVGVTRPDLTADREATVAAVRATFPDPASTIVRSVDPRRRSQAEAVVVALLEHVQDQLRADPHQDERLPS